MPSDQPLYGGVNRRHGLVTVPERAAFSGVIRFYPNDFLSK